MPVVYNVRRERHALVADCGLKRRAICQSFVGQSSCSFVVFPASTLSLKQEHKLEFRSICFMSGLPRLRLVRMARLTSLLRAFPEAMMLLKGAAGLARPLLI